MTVLNISPLDDIQSLIDASQVGDALFFHGIFILSSTLTFWTNRDYNGNGSVFYIRTDRPAIQTLPRPGEPNDLIPRWLNQSPARWLPWSLRLWVARHILRLNIGRGTIVRQFTALDLPPRLVT